MIELLTSASTPTRTPFLDKISTSFILSLLTYSREFSGIKTPLIKFSMPYVSNKRDLYEILFSSEFFTL
jgi:hypothetical protein